MAGTPGPMMSPQPGGPELRGPQDSLGPYGAMGLNGGDFPSSMGGQVKIFARQSHIYLFLLLINSL